ncbi:MAG: sel1 repeat family protein [Magnetococcales bacterium]|nr:sel1 repeat family protein [Magnetococcales bacterium]
MDDFIADVQKSAEQGDDEAQFKLGFMYAKGLGIALDEKQAAIWFGKSAAQGNVGAQFQLDLLQKANKA